ncbi:hypothetical protein E2562_009625 [Oryza meyeriana var. granulata]|uniref:Uncharacterized protein n=1 Tax=Oryza meyeriana var. granulata TaxID=110450 RepID=A0A6G1BKV1_9ORYZ|nr:hypothetical protein E2562_009625 [Oryza meyeriana var. granulata]
MVKLGTTATAATVPHHVVVVFVFLLLLLLLAFDAVAYDPLNGNKAACNPNCPVPGGPYTRGCQSYYHCQS